MSPKTRVPILLFSLLVSKVLCAPSAYWAGYLVRLFDQGHEFLRVLMETRSERLTALAADGSDLCAAASRGISCSLDRGKTWEPLLGRPEYMLPDNFFHAQGLWVVSGPGEDFNLSIFLSRDNGAIWRCFPSNPQALILEKTAVAWGKYLYVLGDIRGLWKGDLQNEKWSLVDTADPLPKIFQTLTATDSALFLMGGMEFWRFPEGGP